jgi:hypothetical protein
MTITIDKTSTARPPGKIERFVATQDSDSRRTLIAALNDPTQSNEGIRDALNSAGREDGFYVARSTVSDFRRDYLRGDAKVLA